MPNLRLFVAADISEAQRTAVLELIESLRKGIQFTNAHPKWVRPEGLHLTLRFLGKVDSQRVEKIVHMVESGLVGSQSFEFDLKRLGVFPDARKPRVLWVGVKKGKRELTDLAGKVDRALVTLGFEAERRPFHPHLTLARIKSMRGAEAMMEVVHSHREAQPGTGRVDHLTLYQSDLSPGGAKYTVLHRWDLREEEE